MLRHVSPQACSMTRAKNKAKPRHATWPLLVTQGEGRRGEALVVARDHDGSVETFCLPRRRRVKPQPAAVGQPASTTVAAARPPRTHPLGLPGTPHRVEGRQGGVERTPELLARGALPCLCLGVVAPDLAPPTSWPRRLAAPR
jgi:hypothetical protein